MIFFCSILFIYNVLNRDLSSWQNIQSSHPKPSSVCRGPLVHLQSKWWTTHRNLFDYLVSLRVQKNGYFTSVTTCKTIPMFLSTFANQVIECRSSTSDSPSTIINVIYFYLSLHWGTLYCTWIIGSNLSPILRVHRQRDTETYPSTL